MKHKSNDQMNRSAESAWYSKYSPGDTMLMMPKRFKMEYNRCRVHPIPQLPPESIVCIEVTPLKPTNQYPN